MLWSCATPYVTYKKLLNFSLFQRSCKIYWCSVFRRCNLLRMVSLLHAAGVLAKAEVPG